MKKSSAVKIISILALGLLVVWAFLPEKKRSNTLPQSYNPPLLINGLSYKAYNNGILVSKMEAEEFKIRPRKFFIFNIKSVNEAILTNVKLNMYLKNKELADIDLLNPIFDATTDKGTGKGTGIGLITRAIIKGIDVNIFISDVLTHKLKATSADFMLKKKRIVFYNASLEHPPSSRLISADKIIWDAQEKAFMVYNLDKTSSTKEKAKGKGLKIDLDFNIKPI
jgi:hypothetical protein